jgi:hypothetical protein
MNRRITALMFPFKTAMLEQASVLINVRSACLAKRNILTSVAIVDRLVFYDDTLLSTIARLLVNFAAHDGIIFHNIGRDSSPLND